MKSQQVHLSLADLGYLSGMRLQGGHGVITARYPLPASGIADGRITLFLEPSAALDARSTVQVFVNDRILTTVTVGQLRQSGTITASLASLDSDSLALRAEGNLWVSDDRCADEASSNLWVSLGKDSSLAYSVRALDGSIRSFLRLPAGTLVVYGLWDSPEDSSASINLISTLQYNLKSYPIKVVLSEDRAPQLAEPVREVHMVANADVLLRLADGKLYVSSAPSALSLLQAEAGETVMSRSVAPLNTMSSPDQGGQALSAPVLHRLSLADLGLAPNEVAGIGTMTQVAHFTLAELGGWPSDLILHLESAFDPVPSDADGRAVLRVRLNGTLLATYDLRGRASLQQTVVLPTNLVRTTNDLELSFAYAPPPSHCQAIPYQFSGQVGGTSLLTWTRYEKARGILPEITTGARGDGKIFFLDPSPSMAQAAARLLGGWSRLAPTAFVPSLGSDPTAPYTGTYRILVGSNPDVARTVKAPVDLSKGIEIVNQRNNTTLLKGMPEQPLAVVEYVADPQPIIILQRGPSGDDSQLARVVDRATDPQRFFGLDGNVILGAQDEAMVLMISATTFQQRTSSPSTWSNVFNRFRWVLWALLSVVAVAAWFFVYRRSGRPAPLPPNPISHTHDT